MRIAVDTNALFTGAAGVARYTRGLLSGLRALQPPLDHFLFAWEVSNLGYGQPFRAIRTLRREILWAKLTAPRRLVRERADLYHATGSFFVSVPPSVRSVVTLHDLAVLRHPERFRAWQRSAERRRLQRLKTVDRIICISRFTANEAMSLLNLPSSKLEVVHNGGDFQTDEGPIPEQAPDIPLPQEFFLFVGSLEPGKNLALLRESYRLAKAEHKALPALAIVGARWVGVGTEGQPPEGWHYLGRQSDQVLVYLYRRALALLFPSKYEGFGLPLVEAMALGCPVVCSKVASLPEVGGKAVLWSDLQPNHYLRSMLDLASNGRLRNELILAGRQQAAQFTWRKCAEGVAQVYRSVCGTP
jgi:alpha-1,3-rhamnosyl/mannosyltransferase